MDLEIGSIHMNRIVLCLALLLFPIVAIGRQSATKTTRQVPSKNVGVSDTRGTELLHFCNMQVGTSGMQFCEAFIVGVRDGVVSATELRDAKPLFETPAQAKQEQLTAAVVKYLNEHPDELHKPAALLVILALSDAFPPSDKATK
jgi:hypothetical protein